MRLCTYCAGYAKEDTSACPTCGRPLPPVEEDANLRSKPIPPLLGKRNLDVENRSPRKTVEWGFVLGCLGMATCSSGSLCFGIMGEQQGYVGFVVFLFCVPLGGLVGAIAIGMLRGLFQSESEATDEPDEEGPEDCPPESNSATTDAEVWPEGNRARASTDITLPGSDSSKIERPRRDEIGR